MKRKRNKAIWLFVILILVIGMVLLYLSQNKTTKAVEGENRATTKVTEVTVGAQTIENTISSSGQISSNETENLELNTYRYFKEIYVEENDFIAEGENILKYTNGTYLTAPYDCVITQISIPKDSGDRCTSQHYITIESTENLLMTLNIDETEIEKVAVGQEVEIVANAYEDKKYIGTIAKINQIGNYASNGSSFTATVEFENDGNLKIGMSASANVTIEKAENVVAVPIEAVQTANGKKYVISKNSDGTTENITIETGISNDAYVEIKTGLKGGETIQMVTTTSTNNKNEKMMNINQMEDGNWKAGGKEMKQEGGGSMPAMQGVPPFGN